MTTTTAATYDRMAVMQAIDAFCAMANAHPSTPRHDWGHEVYYPGRPGAKFTRIVQGTQRPDGSITNCSVHAFVDNMTGDLYKAAGWKAPAKGVRGNIVHDLEGVTARFDWAGGYLYLR